MSQLKIEQRSGNLITLAREAALQEEPGALWEGKARSRHNNLVTAKPKFYFTFPRSFLASSVRPACSYASPSAA